VSQPSANNSSPIDRRHRRVAVNSAAVLSSIDLFEEQPEQFPVTLINISVSGACLNVDRELDLGTFWQLNTNPDDDSSDLLSVMVLWCEPIEQGYQVGVQLLWPASALLPLGVGYMHLMAKDPQNAHRETKTDAPAADMSLPTQPSRIICESDLHLEQAIHSTIQVGGNLTIARNTEHCSLSVTGDLRCEDGCLSGGHARFGDNITTRQLGDTQNTRTVIQHDASLEVELTHQQIDRLNSDIARMNREKDGLQLLGDNLNHHQRERSTVLEFEIASKNETKNNLEQAVRDAIEIASKPEAQQGTLKTEILHAGVELHIGGEVLRVIESITRLLEIQFSPASPARIISDTNAPLLSELPEVTLAPSTENHRDATEQRKIA